MHINTKIINNGIDDDEIIINKFFQFIIVKDINKKTREITIYNAIVLNAINPKKINSSPSLTISYEYDYNFISYKTNDCSHFFEKEDIIKQFLGEKSYFSNNASTCLKKLNKNDKHIPQDLLSYLEKDNACKGYFYIEQSEKENIRKTLIKPIKVEKNTNGVILSDTLTFHNEEYENLISQGYWFKNNFTVSIEKNEKALNLDVAVSLSGAFYKSPDFKIYIQSDKKYELKDTNISVSHSRDDIDKTNSEIVKVFSQSRMKYFDEWQKLGIHENSLFRIKMNSISENKTFKSGINELQLNIKLEDSETPVSREKNLIIFSLFLSLFLSFGFDITRQQELNFQLIFPYLAKEYFTIDALWIFLCLSIFIKYNYLEKTKVNKLIGSFTLLPLLIWFSMYILHPSIYLSFKFLC